MLTQGMLKRGISNRTILIRLLLVLVSAVALSGHLLGQRAASVEVAMTQATAAAPADGASTKGHDDSYVIGDDDVLTVNVWKEPDVSRSLPVRSDGKISLPLAGEVQAAGRTPLKLEQDIASRLKDYISEPDVTVIVQQINSRKFNVLGMVAKPGAYPLRDATTVLDAIASAGGFRDFAKRKSIYVLRQNADGTQAKLVFNYNDVVKGKNVAQNIQIQAHDTIVVP